MQENLSLVEAISQHSNISEEEAEQKIEQICPGVMKIYNTANLAKTDQESFDGSNKSSEGKGQNIKYWEATSPYLEKIKADVMAAASPEAIAFLDPLNYTGPEVLVDASKLTQYEWKLRRKISVGSSGASHVTGDSPYSGCTNYDLYYEKVDQKPLIPLDPLDDESRQLCFRLGHDLEGYLGLWTQLKFNTAKQVVTDTHIYAGKGRPYVTTNLDRMMQRSDGTWVHVEFKTASEYSKESYEDGNIPLHYKRQLIQCQHIMGVWESILVVLFKNNDINDVKVCRYTRDLDEEMDQIKGIDDFWNGNVLARIPPEPLGPADKVIETMKRFSGYGNKNAPEVTLDTQLYADAKAFQEVCEELSLLEAKKKRLQKIKEERMIPLVAAMGQTTKAYVTDGTTAYNISFAPRAGTRTCDYEKLELNYPDIYAQYVTKKKEGSRPMSIKEVGVRT